MGDKSRKAMRGLAIALIAIEAYFIVRLIIAVIPAIFEIGPDGFISLVLLIGLAVIQSILTLYVVKCISDTNESNYRLERSINDLTRELRALRARPAEPPRMKDDTQEQTAVKKDDSRSVPVKAEIDDMGFQICPVCKRKQISLENDECWNCGQKFEKAERDPSDPKV